MAAKMETTIRKFDPEEHKGNALEAFQDFVDSYKYEYEAIAREPPKELKIDVLKKAWMEQNKRKIFLGKFSSRNMQRTFEEVTTEEERSTTTFKDMVTKLNEHFKMGSNTTLSNFGFHRLSQWEEESFNSFAIRVKHESWKCSFKCESTHMPYAYGSNKMKCCGYNVVTVMYDDKIANVGMYIINKNVETLLSGRAAEELGIITFNADSKETGDIRNINTENDPYKAKVIAKHPRIFKGVGILRDYRVKHYFEQSVLPIAEPRRQIPFHLQAKFEREIRAMEEQGIIEEHHGPAPWVSNPVLTPKDDGGMRVTIDMRNANKAIKQTNIPITKVEDIKARLAGSKVFSKIDFKSAFHQL